MAPRSSLFVTEAVECRLGKGRVVGADPDWAEAGEWLACVR